MPFSVCKIVDAIFGSCLACSYQIVKLRTLFVIKLTCSMVRNSLVEIRMTIGTVEIFLLVSAFEM